MSGPNLVPVRRARLALAVLAAALVVPSLALAQPVPKPFPQPGGTQTQQAPPAQQPPVGAPPASLPPAGTPTEAALGMPVYPAAEFLASYDAGLGQRYFLFGTSAAFAEVVAYYKNALRQKGELVFDAPPTHMFEVGKFREDSMAFPPGVTVKDYSWMATGGYRNPKTGAEPQRFPTIIQIVPLASPGTGTRD